MTQFEELFDQYAASSLLKQYALSDFLGDHAWNVDIRAGNVDFGEGRIYPIQLVGTESEGDGTWLWAWANEASNLPAPLLACVEAVRQKGQQDGIPELTTPDLPLSNYSGHALTMLVCGLCGADAYYRGPYEGGALYFLLQQTPLASLPPPPPEQLITILTDVISQFALSHRRMATAFLTQQGYTLNATGNELTATRPDSDSIHLRFDAQDRLQDIQAILTPRNGEG